VIKIHLAANDLGHVRFGISPLAELVASLRVVFTPQEHPLHASWVERAREALEKVDVSLVKSLIDTKGYMPDFLTQPPTDGTPSVSDELSRLQATPPEQVRLEVSRVMNETTTSPESLTPFMKKPRETLDRVADTLERCWSLTLEPYWPQIRSLHETDIRPRARELAMGHTANVLDELHPATHFCGNVLELQDPIGLGAGRRSPPLDFTSKGRGLLLVPEIFAWPRISVILEDYWQPSLFYSPRGVANLWGEPTLSPCKRLSLALGQQRASVLLAVSRPRTTQDIARQLAVTSGNVSHHLGRLRGAGLVEARREGRIMFYALSPKGKALLELFT
jgi:DNA-binding transcriptional ArsR family regulator